MVKTKHIMIGAGAIAAIAGGVYLMKLNRLSNELETVTTMKVHKFSLTSGMDLKVEVTLKNPSGGSIRLKQPFVKLIYKDSTIATSQMVDRNIEVKKFSEVKLEPVMVNISIMTLLTKVPALFNEYRTKGQLTLTVKTVTTINDTLAYSKSDNITLGAGQVA